MANLCWWYYLSKFTEFMDTVSTNMYGSHGCESEVQVLRVPFEPSFPFSQLFIISQFVSHYIFKVLVAAIYSKAARKASMSQG
jgi:hypothetical protein